MKLQKHIYSSWQRQEISVRILRLWLGVTWIYAGWNKATDLGFLDANSSHYIGKELGRYVSTSPISFLLNIMIERAYQVGVLTIVLEFAIGFATLLGVLPLTAALAGLSLSIVLWLSATWGVHPYFLGSDTAYAAMWLAYALSLFSKREGRIFSPDKRGFFRVGVVGALAITSALIGRKFFPANTASLSQSSNGKEIASLDEVPVGGNFKFVTPSGEPAIVYRPSKNKVVAFSTVCTHQGCIVNIDEKNKKLICPCHGAEFDLIHGGAVITGPASRPLLQVAVQISGNSILLG